jgi:hypothetical protein
VGETKVRRYDVHKSRDNAMEAAAFVMQWFTRLSFALLACAEGAKVLRPVCEQLFVSMNRAKTAGPLVDRQIRNIRFRYDILRKRELRWISKMFMRK